jgi:DNA polymerase III alpha subunit (gram-positive type)
MACYDVMVDLETTGTSPDYAGILQLSAVKFNLEKREIGEQFDRCLLLPNSRFWQEDTRHWWGTQKVEVLSEILKRAEDPRTVMQAFADWCGYSHYEPLRFWSKPISFDWPFLQSYLKMFEIANPFHYRNAMDLNTFMRGVTNRSWVTPEVEYEFVGDAHNAIMDSINQIGVLFAAMDGKYKKVEHEV